MKYFILCLILTCFLSVRLYSQAHEDTAGRENIYYTDLSDLLHLRIYSLVKLNTLNISIDNEQLRLQPNGVISLGAGFNFKGFGLGLGIGIPSSQKSIDKYGKTRRFDFQVGIFSKRVGGDAYLQVYKG